MPGLSKSFVCPICQKSFTTNRTKNDHVIVVHQNSGRLKCHCGKSFQKRAHLENHERTHTGEKPFRCRICKRRFTQESNLEAHHRDHHLKKNFECQQCGQEFGREYILKCHLQKHSNSRFECNQCQKLLKHKNSFDRHLKRHSTIQPNTSGQRLLVEEHQHWQEPNEQNADKSFERTSSGQPEVITCSSDESDQDDLSIESSTLASSSCTVTSANLKLVFDVEYRAPDGHSFSTI